MMDEQRDDLTRIKGISEVRQEWFAETFQVVTFQELANLLPERVQQAFKQQGKGVSLRSIESWIAQAQEFAAESTEPAPTQALENVKTSPPLMISNRKDGWKPFASFVVEFQRNEADDYQTMAHFMEKDLGKRWSGIEAVQVCTWMQDQLDVPVLQPAATGGVSNESVMGMNTAVSPKPQPAQPSKQELKASFADRLQIDAVTLLNEQGTLLTNIISHEYDWQIQVDWTLEDGNLFPQNGHWFVSTFLESIGGGPEYMLAAKQITKLDNGNANNLNQLKYTTTIAIKANDPETVRTGIYRMVVAITAQDGNKTALPLASFKDGGMLSIY